MSENGGLITRDRGVTDVTGRALSPRSIDLASFFRPRSVAVIGASDTPRRPTTAMTDKIVSWAQTAGAVVHPVNPNRDEVGGIACVPSILDVPGDVDLAAILVGDPLEALPAVIEKKARFAVIFAAGFAEVGPEGAAKQRQLHELIAGSELHVLGPNTNLNAFEVFRSDLPGRAIALITQSGHQGRPIFQGQELGVRLAYWAPTGNEVDLEFADFAAWFADQPEVGAIAAYIEGFKDGRTLMLAADHAAQRGVPLICIKVGRTDEGRSMAMAHTGHLTGADGVTAAAFRQFGITRVDGLDELLEVSAMFTRTAPPPVDRADGVCVYAISGGTGAHMADLVSAAGLRLCTLRPETQRQLHEWIPPYLRVSNPVDNGGAPSADWRGRKILDAIVADPEVSMVICPITGALPSMGNRLAKDLVDVAATTDKPIFVIWGSPLSDEAAYRDILLPSGLPVFRTFANAVTAAKAYFDYHRFRRRYRSPFTRGLLRPTPASSRVRSAPLGPDEFNSMRVLAEYGIGVPRMELCASPTAAAAAAGRIGYPVVVKGCGPALVHKSEAGVVAVGLRTAAEVRRFTAEMLERAPVADGVLVCEQVSGGVECVVGMSTDPLFGPVIMTGLGGVLVEVLGDVAFRVPPFRRADAKAMVDELKGRALLSGVRGRPAADVEALVDAIMSVQRLALDLASEVREVDINPLAVLSRGQGAIALDALVVPHATLPPATRRKGAVR
jgi:acyl-CoA synthetase (NDP forming)